MARTLHVWLLGHRVGELLQDDSGQLQFRYLDEWLALSDAMPLSVSLPLQKESFPQKLARPFFAGLLPEESNRSIIAAAFGVSKNNDFALLDRIGGECAGAVTLLPEGELAGGPETPLYHPMDAGRHGVACEAVPQGTRSSGDGESKDRGLPSGNQRDDNDATRQ